MMFIIFQLTFRYSAIRKLLLLFPLLHDLLLIHDSNGFSIMSFINLFGKTILVIMLVHSNIVRDQTLMTSFCALCTYSHFFFCFLHFIWRIDFVFIKHLNSKRLIQIKLLPDLVWPWAVPAYFVHIQFDLIFYISIHALLEALI